MNTTSPMPKRKSSTAEDPMNTDVGQNAYKPSKKRKKMCTNTHNPTITAPKEKKTRGKGGRLEFVLEAPTEIVLQILSYLHPLDILNLSYVDKELRALLTSPSSKSVWVTARKNVPDLPDLPPDFTESAYARFLFVKKCEVCGEISHGLEEIAFIRVRLCVKCTKSKCVRIARARGKLKAPVDFEVLVPTFVQKTYHRQRWCFGDTVCYRPALETSERKLKELQHHLERSIYKKERLGLLQSIRATAPALSEWILKQKGASADENNGLRSARLSQISSRLQALGHDEVDMMPYNFSRHSFVSQPTNLSEQGWLKMRLTLESIVQQNKNERLERELATVKHKAVVAVHAGLWNVLPSLSARFSFLSRMDFENLPAVKLLVDDNDLNQTAFEHALATTRSSIVAEVNDFNKLIRFELVQLWHAGCDRPLNFDPRDDANCVAFLQLASTVFYYNTLGSIPPGYLVHYSTLFCDMLQAGADIFCGKHPPYISHWATRRLYLHANKRYFSAVSNILQHHGLDLVKTTTRQLEAANPHWRKECLDMLGIAN